MLTKIPGFQINPTSSCKIPVYFESSNIYDPALAKPKTLEQFAADLPADGPDFDHTAEAKLTFYQRFLDLPLDPLLPNPKETLADVTQFSAAHDADFGFATVWGGMSYFCYVIKNICYIKPVGSGMDAFQTVTFPNTTLKLEPNQFAATIIHVR